MLQRLLGIAAFLGVLILPVGCGGGTAGTGGVALQACGGAASDQFCLVSCNLGCGNITCDLSDIAQNQVIQLNFNQPIDPATVDFATISLRTSAGIEPAGQFVVSGQTVTFVPTVRTIEGQNFFGFEQNQVYTLSLLGGDGPARVVRSTSGDELSSTYECVLRVTLGLVDLNPGPPQAQVSTPVSNRDVATDSSFVLEFDELIDQAAFFGTTVLDGPITVSLSSVNGTECGSGSFPVSGTFSLSSNVVAQRSIWTFRPSDPLPFNVCLRISVTSRVRDLANIAAVPRTFVFFTDPGDGREIVISEDFTTTDRFDPDASGGTWGGGSASFTQLGGDGRHGAFDVTDGVEVVPNAVYEFRTDTQTLSEKPSARETDVTGGEYFFSEFVVPAGRTIRFVGPNPARIHVSGRCEINGTLDLSAATVPGSHNGTDRTGQPGGQPGPGGGRGGDGAFGCDGLGAAGQLNDPAVNFFRGFDGEDLRLPMNHLGLGNETGTGGKGAPLRPAHGDNNQLQYQQLFSPSIGPHQFLVGQVGGGAGFVAPGGVGRIITEGIVGPATSVGNPAPTNPSDPANGLPGADGGIQFDPFASFDPMVSPASVHFLIGGSGGGGGGSNALFSVSPFLTPPASPDNTLWWSGGAGGGGGGALLLRAGSDVDVDGQLLSRGGNVSNIVGGLGLTPTGTLLNGGSPSPGGAGAGGSIVIQGAGDLVVGNAALVDVSGGSGGGYNPPTTLVRGVNIESGDGSPGVLRIELAGGAAPGVFPTGTVAPAIGAQNVGTLVETDRFSLIQSDWYDTGSPFPPSFLRYEIDLTVDGVALTLTDETLAEAAVDGAPVLAYFQGATIDSATGSPVLDPVTGQEVGIRPWRRFVSSVGGPGDPGIGADAVNGYRFQLVIDRVAAGTSNVQIQEVRVVTR
jgi:hypothetical protein